MIASKIYNLNVFQKQIYHSEGYHVFMILAKLFGTAKGVFGLAWKGTDGEAPDVAGETYALRSLSGVGVRLLDCGESGEALLTPVSVVAVALSMSSSLSWRG